MAGSKSYTSESGTTYTQRNDSVYDWHNNWGASGQIRLNPNSGGPTGIYYPIEKRGNLHDVDSPLSQEYVDKHVRNIQEGLKKNGFVAPPSLWTDFRNWFGPKIVQLGEWITANQNGGRLQNFINNTPASKKEGGSINYSKLFVK